MKKRYVYGFLLLAGSVLWHVGRQGSIGNRGGPDLLATGWNFAAAQGADGGPESSAGPDLAELWHRGFTAIEHENWDLAITHLSQARKLAPESPPVLYYLGVAHAQAGHKREAIAAFTSYLTAAPDADNVALVREQVRILNGQNPQLAAVEEVLKLPDVTLLLDNAAKQTAANLFGAKEITVNFDEPDAKNGPVTGDKLARYLDKFGLLVQNPTAGTQVAILNTRNLYEGKAAEAQSSPNLLTQTGSNEPVGFTLMLTIPADNIRFTRPKLLAGPSGVIHPSWKVEAFNSIGEVIDSVSEDLLRSFQDVPAREFRLKGPRIAWLRVSSDNQHIAGFNALLLDDLAIAWR